MTRTRLRKAALTMAAAGIVSAGAAAISAAASTGAAAPVPAGVVVIHPDAIHAGKASSSPYTTAQCEQKVHIACYGPGQLRQAYNVWPLYRKGITGKGTTIVIVDSYGSPTINTISASSTPPTSSRLLPRSK